MKKFLAFCALACTTLAASAAFAYQNVLNCWEADAWGGRYLTAQVDDDSGRLLAKVYANTDDTSRLLKQVGVAERSAAGREFDVIYLERDLKLSVNSQTLKARLETTIDGRRRITVMECE